MMINNYDSARNPNIGLAPLTHQAKSPNTSWASCKSAQF